MNIFVAGSTGVIGRLLLPMLVEAGHEVTGMTHREDGAAFVRSVGGRAVLADAFDREAVIRAVKEARPDVIIHQLTALKDWDLESNAKIRKEGTRNLTEAALAAGVPRMIAQSISWAYEGGDTPASEEVPLDTAAPSPRKATIDAVFALETEAAKIPQHVILRYGMLYGPGTWYDANGIMADRIRGKQVPASDGITSFLHVRDAARAAMLALSWPSGAVNIVDDEPAAGRQWLPVYAEAIGASAPDLQPGRQPFERGASNAKARRSYGWEPLFPTWRTGFSQSVR